MGGPTNASGEHRKGVEEPSDLAALISIEATPETDTVVNS